jgi:hypothetical protein
VGGHGGALYQAGQIAFCGLHHNHSRRRAQSLFLVLGLAFGTQTQGHRPTSLQKIKQKESVSGRGPTRQYLDTRPRTPNGLHNCSSLIIRHALEPSARHSFATRPGGPHHLVANPTRGVYCGISLLRAVQWLYCRSGRSHHLENVGTPKCKLFAWLIFQNRVWTSDRLARREWDHCPSCPLCRQTMEIAHHLLASCRYTQNLGISGGMGGAHRAQAGSMVEEPLKSS